MEIGMMIRRTIGCLIFSCLLGLSASGLLAEDRKMKSTFSFQPARGLPTSRQTEQALSVVVYLLQRIWLYEYTGHPVSLPNFKYCSDSQMGDMLLDGQPTSGFWMHKCGPVQSLGVSGNAREGYTLKISLLPFAELDKVASGLTEVLTSNDLGKYKSRVEENIKFKEFLALTHGSNMYLLRNSLDVDSVFDMSKTSVSAVSHRRALIAFRSLSAGKFDIKIIRRDQLTTLSINIPAELMN
jgi:hypothetical protein